jgi:hypothetical protein
MFYKGELRMNLEVKEKFLSNWKKYFGMSELPIVCYYGDDFGSAVKVKSSGKWSCLIAELIRVRKGKSLKYDEASLGCGGAKRQLGYTDNVMPGFEYFLSCGIPGRMEGERYIRTPEMVLELQKIRKQLPVNGKNIVFKRWDNLVETDNPEIVIFFAKPDVLSGLFSLANFDQTEPNGTFCPFGSGCDSIIYYPYLEKDAERPRAVIGMFDPSARPYVPADILTFSVPMVKFVKMINVMDESFLITESWKKILKKLYAVR